MTAVGDAASTTADAAGKQVVVISSTVSSGNVGTKFRSVTIPVLTWEHALWDDLGMTAAAGTQVSGQTSVAIVTPGSPLAAGLTGTVAVSTTTDTLPQGVPGAAAVIVARLPGTTTASDFAYDTGAAMPGLAAPARRVGLFLGDNTAAIFTANGWALFDAAVTWARNQGGGGPSPSARRRARARRRRRARQPEPVAEPVAEPVVPAPAPRRAAAPARPSSSSAATRPRSGPLTTAVRTRLQGLGYVVTAVGDAASTTADAAGKQVVVISSTVSSGNVGTKFRSVTIPVLTWEHALWDDLGMTAAAGTQVSGQTSVAIVTPGSPLAAGLTGTVAVSTAADTLPQGIPGAAAVIVARLPGTTTASDFAYDTGAAMPGLAAPARRVGLFMGDNTAAIVHRQRLGPVRRRGHLGAEPGRGWPPPSRRRSWRPMSVLAMAMSPRVATAVPRSRHAFRLACC